MTKDWNDVYNIHKEFFDTGFFWGMECGYGWHELVKNLVQDIYNWYKENKENELDEFKILQIKEKYGTLRFYVGGSYEEVFDIISKAEDASYTICELCGKDGEVRDIGGWYQCLCKEHYNERMIKVFGVISEE